MTDKEKKDIIDEELKKTRITFSGNRLAGMQQVTNQLVANAKAQNVKIAGPVRLPIKHLHITTRRTPCGEGSKTWDHYEMSIYKRYIDLECTAGQMKEVTSLTIPNGIDINVDIRSAA